MTTRTNHTAQPDRINPDRPTRARTGNLTAMATRHPQVPVLWFECDEEIADLGR